MARDIQVINNEIVADYVARMAANGITIDPTLWSKRNMQRLLLYSASVETAVFEQLQDAYTTELEAIIAASPAANKAWLQAMVFKFQYDATNPQVIQLNTDTFSYYYPTIDETLRIVSRCAVISTVDNVVSIKVATNEPPQALTSPQVSALQSYVTTIGDAGVTYNVTSAASDKIYLGIDLYYFGQYASVILDNVVAAINTYLSGIPFNGIMLLTDLEIAIKSVTGVSDVVLKEIYARADVTPFANATKLVSNSTEFQRSWPTFAGYMVPETTAGQTPTDSINLIAV